MRNLEASFFTDVLLLFLTQHSLSCKRAKGSLLVIKVDKEKDQMIILVVYLKLEMKGEIERDSSVL